MIKRLLKKIHAKVYGHGSSSRIKTTQKTTTLSKQADSDTQHNEPQTVIDIKDSAAAPQQSTSRGKRKKRKKWTVSQFEVVPEVGKNRFHDFDLANSLMHSIADLNFQYCTAIQAATLSETLKGSDAIGQAQTGTGKTAAFLITILNKFIASPRPQQRKNGAPRALVIAPTRELVRQISQDAEFLAKYSRVSVMAVFGGIDYQKQQQMLTDKQIDVLVATPGRLLDFQRRQIVDLGKVEIIVIDEADRMLDMGFIPDVRRIIYSTPPKEKRQTLLFSATLTPDVKRLAYQWCKKPITVEIEPENVSVDTVEQITYMTTRQEKYAVLYNLITQQKLNRVMVFANRRDETRRLTERLKRNNINCAMLSGEVAQKQRMSTLEKFSEGKIKILVATDVASRGIHIDGVSHVVNYTLPEEPENYVHRIGRTGRAGHSGISISFATEDDGFSLPDIEEYIGKKLKCVYPEENLLKAPPKGSDKTFSKRRPQKNHRPPQKKYRKPRHQKAKD